MIMRITSPIIAATILAAALGGPAMAISTLDDTERDAPRIFRIPSSDPPNNALQRQLAPPQSNEPANPDAAGADEGPQRDAGVATPSGTTFPWTAAISEGPNLDQDFVCAGALIAPNWILTAAHCTYNAARRWPNDSSAFAFTDVTNLSAPRRRFAIEQIVQHPQYDPRTLRNDLALLRIDAKGDAASAPISINGPPISEVTGEVISILGWGITTSNYDRHHRENLQIIQAAILDNGVCFSNENYPGLRNTGVFCAKSLLRYHDVCFRFGGSPLTVYDVKGRLYLAGIVSWSATCAQENRKPNIYLDVQAYVPWIKSVIEKGGK
jgi:secreted trypsin-like serine protease